MIPVHFGAFGALILRSDHWPSFTVLFALSLHRPPPPPRGFPLTQISRWVLSPFSPISDRQHAPRRSNHISILQRCQTCLVLGCVNHASAGFAQPRTVFSYITVQIHTTESHFVCRKDKSGDCVGKRKLIICRMIWKVARGGGGGWLGSEWGQSAMSL